MNSIKVLSWSELEESTPTSIAIGNFDGVHLGHQALIKKCLENAEKHRLKPLVLTFYPHPMKVLGKKERLILTPLEEKVRLIRLYGIEHVIVLQFSRELSLMEPEEFIEEVLVKRLKCKALTVGENFRFGRDRKGDTETLDSASKTWNFLFTPVSQVVLDGIPVSSTRIRRLIREGRVERAAKFLGRPYKVVGKVVSGKGRGKRLGFPTANIDPENEIIPKNGVYAAFAHVKSALMKSVVNIGKKPTFGDEELTIEAHIIGLDEDLYGERIGLYFVARLRDEKKFGSIEELAQAISRDRERGATLLEWDAWLKV